MYFRYFILCGLVAMIGCTDFLTARDHEIKKYTKAITSANDALVQARALSDRGHAYSEKARYGKFFKKINQDEYQKFFDLAVTDQNESIKLAPNIAEMYFQRAVTYYDRAGLESKETSKSWYHLAELDFQKATELDPKYNLAFDRLGLAYESEADYDNALVAYGHETEERLKKMRLADVYCERGSAFLINKKMPEAIDDLSKSVEIGSTTDGCSCEPYNGLLSAYIDTKDYSKGWELVSKAKSSKKFIAPELLQSLQQKSGVSK